MILGSVCFLYLACLLPVNTVLIELHQTEPICLSVDLDSHKMVLVEASVKHQPQCEVELIIDSNNEIDIMENKPFQRRKYELFNCQHLPSTKYIQKFVEDDSQKGLHKFRVCAQSRLPQPVIISLSVKEVATPEFQQFENQQLSLVSSSELLLLRQDMLNITKALVRMEPLGENFVQTEEMIYRTYTQQKQTINFITKLQIGLILMIGVVWLLAFRAIGDQKV